MKMKVVMIATISAYMYVELICMTLMAAQTRVPSMNSLGQEQSAGLHNQYKEVKAGRGITKDGVQASFQTYVSDNGVTVFTRVEFFRSRSDMTTQVEAKIQKLSLIIDRDNTEQSKETGGISRETKGERIVGKRVPDEQGRELYCILVTNDNRISYIESASLDTILDFEKVFRIRK